MSTIDCNVCLYLFGYRLSERIFDGVEDTLEEIRLGGNKLGDQLNPIFSTNELRNLKRLKFLDLSRNMIKGIEDGILTGCHNLKVRFNEDFLNH